ncbi:MarR family winged helix-turn-helix transcriptional regulator [Actinoallomurus sp. CA-142502]|uniref:MarR family winged helix-turn-helix transcriptional regulator n=1 Tax=Actinoallomurus sp. CA-142502 TaxID=3239885 RepID=UPI003D94BC13
MSGSPAPGAPPSGEDVFARVAWALRRADLNLQTAKERPLREIGVPGSHYAVLISLQTSPGLTGAELARLVGITPQAVALLVGKLTDRGLIERRTHPRHRNVQELHLTDAGRDELTKAECIISDLERHIRESLGVQGYRQLRELLGQVMDDLPNWDPPKVG